LQAIGKVFVPLAFFSINCALLHFKLSKWLQVRLLCNFCFVNFIFIGLNMKLKVSYPQHQGKSLSDLFFSFSLNALLYLREMRKMRRLTNEGKDVLSSVAWNSNNEVFSCGDDKTVQRWSLSGEPSGQVLCSLCLESERKRFLP
jgi:WD40 repeat protein